MKVRERFLASLKGKDYFTFSEAKAWYREDKPGRVVYGANVYALLINPLLDESLIEKRDRGLYFILATELSEAKAPTGPKERDEFDAYLKEKGIR